MGYVLDIIIVAVFVLCIASATKKGFIKTVMGTVSLLLALILTFAFYQPVKEMMLKSEVTENLKGVITEKLESIEVDSEGNFDIESLMENKPEEFLEVLESFGIDYNELNLQYQGWLSESTVNVREKLISVIINPIVDLLASGIAILALFLVCFFAIKLATYLLDKVFKLPILKQANKALGFVLGAMNGLVCVYILSAIVILLIPYLKTKGIDIDPSSSFVFKLFSDNTNIVLNFISGK